MSTLFVSVVVFWVAFLFGSYCGARAERRDQCEREALREMVKLMPNPPEFPEMRGK